MAKELLVVDTNIISHALTPNQTAAYEDLFKNLEKQYAFSVTAYTKFELMCSSDKKHRAKIEEYISQDMVRFSLSEPLMDFAARVYFLYAKHPSTKGYKISMADIVNASVAIIKKCPLITIDNNDYPTPFFQEIDRRRVTYTGKNKEVTDTVYILRPDIDNIKECFKKHDA